MKLFVAIVSLCAATSVFAQSDSSSFYLNKGLEEKKARRFREAEKNFAKASSFAPANLEILKEHAQSLIAQNRYQEAREIYIKAEKINADDQSVIDNLTTLSFNLRKWDDAIKYASRNKTSPVNYIIGRSYYEQENYAEAMKWLTKAAAEEPGRAEIPYIMGRAYLDMSNYKQAASNFDKAIALDSTKAQWIYEAALVHYAVPDYPGSLRLMLLAGQKGYPRNNDYLTNLGNAYVNVKQFDKGAELYKEVLQRRPNDQELLYNLAQAYYDGKQYQQAIDTWDQLFGLDKTNAKVLYMIGMSYQKKGDKGKGQALCDKAIEMDPSLAKNKQKMSMPGM